MTIPGDAIPSPNIWDNPATYELENQSADQGRVIEAAMAAIADWTGRTLLDVGCGTGFHLPRWAESARSTIGVEPHPDLLAIARRRVRRLASVTVLQGRAERLPLPDASVDVVHARWAYFFGPGCEPGLAELARVVRRGGTAFIVDNDATRSTFGGWLRRGYPHREPGPLETFWSTQGWTRQPLDITWKFNSTDDFERVVRIEFPPGLADEIVAEHSAPPGLGTPASSRGGCEVDYAVNLWWRHY